HTLSLTHTLTHTHTDHTDTQTDITQKHTHTHTHIYTRIHTHTHTHSKHRLTNVLQRHRQTLETCMQSSNLSQTHTHTHTHTRTHTHTQLKREMLEGKHTQQHDTETKQKRTLRGVSSACTHVQHTHHIR